MKIRAASPVLLATALLASLPACTTQVVCTSDQVAVGGQCISIQSDPANCGAVGRACAAGQSCSAGLCCQGSQCPPAVYAACFNTGAVQGATAGAAAVGAPVAVETGPIALTWQGSKLWVANSISNSLDRMTVSPAGLAPDGAFPTVLVHTSAPFFDLEFLAEKDGLLYASNAAVGTLLVVDPAAPSPVVAEIGLGGAYAYPQGIAFSGTKAYVALNGSGGVAVVDLVARALAKTIDHSILAGAGASPMPSRIAVSGGRAYVSLWNLGASTYAPLPGQHGLLAVIDTATDALVPGVNPVDLGAACLDPAALAVLGTTAWVSCGFFAWNATSAADVIGAALVPVDLSGASPNVGAAVPVSLAAPGAITFCGGVGWVADRFSGDLLRFDPIARAVTTRGLVCAPLAGSSSFAADVACGK